MGVVILGINGGFFPNSAFPLQNSSNSTLPIAHIASNFAPAKKNLDFDGRKPRFGRLGIGIGFNFVSKKKSWDFDVRSAKVWESSTLESPSMEVIEKELKFSPMFNDYVKVMESVRTDRSKNSSEDVGEVCPKKRSMGRVDSSRVAEKIDSGGEKLGYRRKVMEVKNRRHGNGEGSRSGDESGWGLVERIMEKRTSGRRCNDSKDVSKRVGHLEKAMVRVQNGREVRSRSKDVLKSGSSVQFCEIERGGRSAKQFYDKNVDGIDNGRVGFGRKKINQSKDENIYKNVDAKIGGLYTSKVSQGGV